MASAVASATILGSFMNAPQPNAPRIMLSTLFEMAISKMRRSLLMCSCFKPLSVIEPQPYLSTNNPFWRSKLRKFGAAQVITSTLYQSDSSSNSGADVSVLMTVTPGV